MHEVYDVEIPEALWTFCLIVVVSFLIFNCTKAAAGRRAEILKLQKLAADEIARVEREEAVEYSSRLLRASNVQNYSSPSIVINHPPITAEETVGLQLSSHSSSIPTQTSVLKSRRTLVGSGLCTVCATPTKKQCSGCKAVKYCSRECQVAHWLDGHKQECQKLRKQSAKTTAISDVALTFENSESPVTKEDNSYGSVTSEEERGEEEETLPAAPSKSLQGLETFTTTGNGSLLSPSEVKRGEEETLPETLPAAPSECLQSLETFTTTGNGSLRSPVKVKRGEEETLPAAPSKFLQSSETFTSTGNGMYVSSSKILFSYKQFIELFGWTSLKLAPCGLVNCGNSCFANVVLQCLTFTRPLAAYLLKGGHSEECQREWCFMCELQRHVFRVMESQVAFSPSGIVSQIPNIGKHMGHGRQEDAHEFMRFAIDSMQSICLDKVGGEKAVDQQTQETTVIHHIFGGRLQSQVRCMQCQYESCKYEKMMDLAVEIQGNVETLEDALTQFTSPESLDGENKYKCDRCNAYVRAWKRLVVHEAPNILMIAFKRFQSGKFGKLNKRVTFPKTLDMSSYMSEEGDDPLLYQLYGVIVHIDMLNASFFGHYICYIKDFQGSWYQIDDSKVKEVDLDMVMQQRAYMLLYTRYSPRYVHNVHKRGVCISEDIAANVHNSKKSALPNGNHLLPKRTASFRDAANGNAAKIHSNNSQVLTSESSDFLTQ